MRTAIMIPLLAALLTAQVAAEEPCPTSACKTNSKCRREEQTPKVCQLFPPTQVQAEGRFVMKRWQIANRREEKIPHQGLLIVHVCSGSLTVGAGSARQTWGEGTFWSVPANQPLIVHTARDSAVLQTVDIIMP